MVSFYPKVRQGRVFDLCRETMQKLEVKQMAKTMKISRKRKELISKYATAAVFLYGVISVE
jgi:hypothetical protein